MVDSPSEGGSFLEDVMLPGGSEKTTFSTIGVESTIVVNLVERMVDSPSEEECVLDYFMLPGGN